MTHPHVITHKVRSAAKKTHEKDLQNSNITIRDAVMHLFQTECEYNI
jgi:hypothetical protein